MIHVFIGTKAQFIKMVPVMVELRKRDIPFRYVDSGQHAGLTGSLRKVFHVREPDVSLRRADTDIDSIPGAAGWFARQTWTGLRGPERIREGVFPGGGICLIHGDTLSTLLGMRLAKRAGLEVAMVEAGLRSHSYLHPFPEEMIRMYCMQRSDLLFVPSDEAEENLKGMRIFGKVINTKGNTVADSLRLMDGFTSNMEIPKAPYALAACHRLETLLRRARLARVVSLLNHVAERMPVVFVTHGPTRKYLGRYGLDRQLSPGIRRLDMLDYPDFIALIKAARMVLADGGSIQEECAYLNKPCLILRMKTERQDGLGRNARLWRFNDQEARDFLDWAEAYEGTDPVEMPQPSRRIVDSLIRLGHGADNLPGEAKDD